MGAARRERRLRKCDDAVCSLARGAHTKCFGHVSIDVRTTVCDWSFRNLSVEEKVSQEGDGSRRPRVFAASPSARDIPHAQSCESHPRGCPDRRHRTHARTHPFAPHQLTSHRPCEQRWLLSPPPSSPSRPPPPRPRAAPRPAVTSPSAPAASRCPLSTRRYAPSFADRSSGRARRRRRASPPAATPVPLHQQITCVLFPRRVPRWLTSPSPPPDAPSQIAPVGDRVLVKIAEAEKTTAGGIILAESAQRKPTSGASLIPPARSILSDLNPVAPNDPHFPPAPCARSPLARLSILGLVR